MIYSFLTSYYGNINNYKNTLALLKKQLVNNDLEWLPFTTFGDKKQLYFEAVNYFLNKKQWQNSICDVILNCLSKLHKCRIQVCVVENSFIRMIILVTFDREYQKIIHLKFESQHYEAILSNNSTTLNTPNQFNHPNSQQLVSNRNQQEYNTEKMDYQQSLNESHTNRITQTNRKFKFTRKTLDPSTNLTDYISEQTIVDETMVDVSMVDESMPLMDHSAYYKRKRNPNEIYEEINDEIENEIKKNKLQRMNADIRTLMTISDTQNTLNKVNV